MPVDPTRASISSRRPQKKVTDEELKEIELKRIRGELSCAECRRLKLRCDKKVPCSSCCRRGCESICPCGILSAGQGTRFILADTEQLHRKIADMSHRIRQLEDALAIIQSTVSDERHPLLQDDLLKIKFGPEAPDIHLESSAPDEQTRKQSIDALGTLTLGDSGEVKYFGRSAGSEMLLMAGEESDTDNDDEDERMHIAMTPILQKLANLFPFTMQKTPDPNTLELLESFLPTKERAWSLSESYLLHGAYFFRPVKRDELLNTMIPTIYNAASERVRARVNSDASSPNSDKLYEAACDGYSPHTLATLFFVFALGALLDLNLPPYNAEAEQYYQLGRAALSLRSAFDSPQIDTIQAIGFMATYHTSGGKKYTRDSAWCLMSFAAKLAQSIGLHRDSARWYMDPQMVQKRRTLFWEIFAADMSHCLALGRPPAIHLSYVDCEFPMDEESSLSDAGEMQNGFWRMKYTFARDMFFAVVEATLTATPPSYKTILDLDTRVREISFPTAFKPYVQREDGEEEYFSSSASLRGFYASQHRTVTMLYLHRSFFAQAMLDHPSNPLLSPFAPSFLTAYRCASIVIKASVYQFDRCAEMAMRVWFLMCHTFSAALIAGTIVTRSPSSTVASSALLDLNQAVELFERTAIQSQRAKVALVVLRKLKEKAIRSYTQYRSPSQPARANHPQFFPSSPDTQQMQDIEDELAIFGGQTRVLARKTKCKCCVSTSSGADSSPSPSASAGGPASPSTVVSSLEPGQQATATPELNAHPTPVEYLGAQPFTVGYDTPKQTNPSNNDGQSSVQQNVNVTSTFAINPSANPPSGKQMGEMFSSFMGYLANRSISNANIALPTPDPRSNPYQSTQQNVRQQWDGKMGDSTFPQADHSFGWRPQEISTRQLPLSNSPNTASTSMFPPSPSTLPLQSSHQQTEFIPVDGTTDQPYSDYESHAGSASYPQYASAPTDPAGAMVELGLVTESKIDSGWFSLMQDCGISMDSPRNM